MRAAVVNGDQILTNSRLRAFRACARYHHYKYDLRRSSVRDAATAKFGDVGHKALEQWWLTRQEHRPGEAIGAALAELDKHKSSLDPYEMARLFELIRGYDARWYDSKLEPLMVEAEFDAPLVNPETNAASRNWRIGGKVDVIVYDPTDRRCYLMEHKFTTADASEGSEYWRRLRIDGQISIYYDGAGALGVDISGCVYDVLVKPALKPSKATPLENRRMTKGKQCALCDGSGRNEIGGQTLVCSACGGSGWKEAPRPHGATRFVDEPPEEFQTRVHEAIIGEPTRYYTRGMVVRLDNEIFDHRVDIWEQAQLLRAAEIRGRFPRNPDSCIQYSRTCEFFDVCVGQAEITDHYLYQIRPKYHPELSGGSEWQKQAPTEPARLPSPLDSGESQ